MIDFSQGVVLTSAVISVLMTISWIGSLLVKNASIVDIFWGIGFVLIGWATWFVFGDPSQNSLQKSLMLALITIWGLRLSAFIHARNHGRPEDFRYAAWRENSGRQWWRQSDEQRSLALYAPSELFWSGHAMEGVLSDRGRSRFLEDDLFAADHDLPANASVGSVFIGEDHAGKTRMPGIHPDHQPLHPRSISQTGMIISRVRS
jgi:hypothetical protein